MSIPKDLRTLKTNFEKADGLGTRENVSCDLCDGGQNLPPMVGIGLIKLSENLGATAVAPVAPVDTSLQCAWLLVKYAQ